MPAMAKWKWLELLAFSYTPHHQIALTWTNNLNTKIIPTKCRVNTAKNNIEMLLYRDQEITSKVSDCMHTMELCYSGHHF